MESQHIAQQLENQVITFIQSLLLSKDLSVLVKYNVLYENNAQTHTKEKMMAVTQ